MADAYTKMCLLVDLDKLPQEVNKELEEADDNQDRMRIFNRYTYSFLEAAVGRRLTKIVRGKDDQKPRLFLEPVYTPLERESTARLFNAFAVTNLAKLGIPLVKGGGSSKVYVSESRNKRQYEDGESGGPGGGGAGLGTQEGSYFMPAQPLQESDYMLK